ncbi:MAG: 6-phosphogluconolactonase [Xanthomonadaceae bacterium]|nr:6-phosphogluconolactonase [Xanthomonadaceae bacterium]
MSGGLTEHRFTSNEAATAALAEAILGRLSAAIAERGVASLIVSGGKSPVPLFARLRVAALDWSKVWITLADERWVEPTSPDSNERLLLEHLLRDAAAAARFVPLKSASGQVADGLVASSAALAAIPRPFDVVVLGMGEDGHTASLFPGTEGLAAALAPDNPAALAAITPLTAPHPRITLTLAALLDARCVMLPLAGATKLAVYRRARVEPDPLAWPISAVLTQTRTAVEIWLAD